MEGRSPGSRRHSHHGDFSCGLRQVCAGPLLTRETEVAGMQAREPARRLPRAGGDVPVRICLCIAADVTAQC